jgi:hypothetical protein
MRNATLESLALLRRYPPLSRYLLGLDRCTQQEGDASAS